MDVKGNYDLRIMYLTARSSQVQRPRVPAQPSFKPSSPAHACHPAIPYANDTHTNESPALLHPAYNVR